MAGKHIDIDEIRRLTALNSVAIMDSLPEERFDRLARIAKNQFKVSITLITFIDAERQWFKTHLGIPETEGPRASSFCNLTITEDRVLYIPDAAEDDRFHDNPMVTGSPHIRFYAGAPIRTADGQRIGTLCLADATPRILDADDLKSIRDIADCIEQELTQTDRGAVYAAHQASRFSAMIESVGDAILGLDEKGTIRSANSAVREVFGYAPDELFAQNLSTIMSAAHRFRADPQTGVTDDETVWVDADGDDRYLDGRRKDGSTFHMQLVITEMAHFGQRQFVAVARDVTEQKTQELYLDAIIENIPNMVFVKDAEDLCFTLFNRAGEELIGARRDVLIGKSDFDFVPREQAEAFTTKDREVLQQTGVVDIWEEPIDTRTKGQRLLHTRKIAIRDEQGVPKYLLGISEDITDRKRIEKELAISLEETERASRGKSEFLANMSHELRSPLNSIIGFAQIMRDGYFGALDKRYTEYLTDIYSSASHLLELINEILDISRIEAGELSLDEAEFDMALPVEEAIRLTAVHTDAKDQILVNDVTPDLVQIKADTRQIRQILINLLSNAVRFTPEGGTITVSCEKTDPGGVALRVTDTGIGIAARDIPKVLEPFGQVRHDSLRAHGGTGLGLTLSKHLIEMHGGTLEIESAPGEGTIVIVTLPRERVL